MRPVALAGILASTTILGGCAGTIAGVSLSSISSFAGFASTLFTGADLGEHAVSIVTGKDCRFSEGLMREDRDVCEEPGSLATRDDFHGIFIDRIEADGTVIYAAPKYMSAGVGAGENENNPDAIWAEIKSQKVKEEGERQLARAQAAQSIDVAALATGSLSPESLAFLPGGVSVANEITDGDTASQTASRPRPVVNAAGAPKSREAKATTDAPVDADQPAIEEAALTVPLQAAKATGQGGPLFATATSNAPVVSTLIKGEPVVIMRIGPIFGMASTSTTDTASAVDSALPSEVVEETPAPVFARPATRVATAPSPQAILKQLPTEVTLAAVEPQMTAARPRTKPAAELIAPAPVETAVEKPKPAVPKVVRKRPETVEAAADVYQPPAREGDALASSAPDLAGSSPVQVPGDIPAAASEPVAAYAPPASDAETPATSGPAPLVPMAQP